MLPVYPLFGSGSTRLQPAYVEDVGEAISRLIAEPRSAGAVYELAGPRAYTYRALLEEIAEPSGCGAAFSPCRSRPGKRSQPSQNKFPRPG